jgi:3-hydroxyisobutyrate dehydrogenase-like beta-hydroxyacid dehydrogenase
MGAPMAGHLLSAGMDVVVWNRTAQKSAPLREKGAHIAESLQALASGCARIALCVGRTEDVRECVAELSRTAGPGTLIVDHSTIAPQGAQEIHEELTKAGLRFVDAPITGGSMGAQAGTLTIFMGGMDADVAEAQEMVRPYAKRAEHVGGPGSGQMTKLANQIAVAGSLLGLCESLAFAKRAGLNLELTRELLSGGAAGSWAFDNYGPRILAQNWSPGFSIKNQRKDFGYCHDAAAALGMDLPGTELTDQLLAILDDAGRGEDATTALFQVLEARLR